MSSSMSWLAIQARVWSCNACQGHPRVHTNIRQQTQAATRLIRLLFIGVAPPAQGSPATRTTAKSATNDPEDKLRRFIESAAGVAWDDLAAHGTFLIHAVKCPIAPDAGGFQNPPNDVIDRCSQIGSVDELRCFQPACIVAFGGAARRAVLKRPDITAPSGVGVSKTFADLQKTWPNGIPCMLGTSRVCLHPAPFPRSPAAKKEAAAIIRDTVHRTMASVENRTE
jgi:uracil-DNA glycosylase